LLLNLNVKPVYAGHSYIFSKPEKGFFFFLFVKWMEQSYRLSDFPLVAYTSVINVPSRTRNYILITLLSHIHHPSIVISSVCKHRVLTSASLGNLSVLKLTKIFYSSR
jgi:hypothetical protein